MKVLKFILIFLCLFQFSLSQDNFKLPGDLDKYLNEKESQYNDIIPNTEKKIVWNNNIKDQSKYSIVYLHGFSATRQEIAPVCDDIAKEINANVFYTRFTGHGRTSEALGQATLDDWKNDVLESIAIGKSIGKKVIVIATSTGATLATWYADKHSEEKDIIYILISPNFEVKNRGAKLLGTPILGKFVANHLIKNYSRKVDTPEESKYWTISYPTKAIIPMMKIINEANKIKYSKLEQRMLIVHTNIDRAVNAKKTDKVFSKLNGANKKLIVFDDATERGHHVLAGDIMAPDKTKEVEDKILEFLNLN